MNLSPPTTAVFIISVVLAVLAIIGTFAAIPVISANAFWVAIIAYIILAVGNLFRGLSPRRGLRTAGNPIRRLLSYSPSLDLLPVRLVRETLERRQVRSGRSPRSV